MAKIWTIGEFIVEIMRPTVGTELGTPGDFRGPFPSGAPAIFIDTAARLGVESAAIGCVGNDDFGHAVIKRLTKDGVDISHLAVNERISTGCAFVTYFEDGSRKFLFHIGNAASGSITSPDDGCEKGAEFLHVCGCSLSASATMGEEIIKTVRKFVAAGARISFDPNIRPELLHDDSSLGVINEVLENTSVLLPGVGELLMLTGEETVDAAVEKLFKNPRLDVIAIKDGKRGSRIISRNEDFTMGIYPIEVLDATGAGDSFDAAIVAGIVEGRSLRECAQRATAASALGIHGFGPMEGDITIANVEKLICENEVK